jgi:flagellar biosynthesis repressor protein FlbT
MMQIHLKKNEKLYLNGAVIRLDRRGTIELLNDADFLMENHVMQPEQASTPLRQVYFVVQLMLMDPPNAPLLKELFKVNMAQLRRTSTEALTDVAETIEQRVLEGGYFEAMKLIRQSYGFEDASKYNAPSAAIQNFEQCEASA